jgi:hypothetical protein
VLLKKVIGYPVDHFASGNRKLYAMQIVFCNSAGGNRIKIKMCISGLNLSVPSAILKLLKPIQQYNFQVNLIWRKATFKVCVFIWRWITGKITEMQLFSTFMDVVSNLMEFYVALYGIDKDVPINLQFQ